MLSEFEQYISEHHPDPDSMIMMDIFNLREGEQVRIGYESKQITLLAERFAEYKVKQALEDVKK